MKVSDKEFSPSILSDRPFVISQILRTGSPFSKYFTQFRERKFPHYYRNARRTVITDQIYICISRNLVQHPPRGGLFLFAEIITLLSGVRRRHVRVHTNRKRIAGLYFVRIMLPAAESAYTLRNRDHSQPAWTYIKQ